MRYHSFSLSLFVSALTVATSTSSAEIQCVNEEKVIEFHFSGPGGTGPAVLTFQQASYQLSCHSLSCVGETEKGSAVGVILNTRGIPDELTIAIIGQTFLHLKLPIDCDVTRSE